MHIRRIAFASGHSERSEESITMCARDHGDGFFPAFGMTNLVGLCRILASFAAFGLLLVGCGRKEAVPDPATRETVWAAIQPLAERYRLDPAFIFALVAAESNFDPQARNGEARGLMQIKPGAWRTVNREPYEPNVWAWRKNLAAGVDYLAWCRSALHERKKFSYPVLLASFHYGLDYVEARDFDLDRLEAPGSAIYRELWRGNLAPVPPPKMQIPR